MNTLFKSLLVFIPLTLAAYFFHFSETLVFFLSAIAIVPLAKFIGEATEELATHTGPAFGGFLKASFGNATELIIGIFALHAGLIEVVKASMIGSIIGNLLLVLGTAIFFGGIKKEKQKFNQTAAKANASTLLLAVTALVIPAILVMAAPSISIQSTQNLSYVVAILLILAYGAYLLFSLYTHKHLYAEDEAEVLEVKWSLSKSIVVLLVSTIFVAWMSDILVNSIQPLVASFGWTDLFIGVIFIAIIGNAAEHVSAVTIAVKNRMDLALQISIGSAIQISMFIAPLLVLATIFMKVKMNLVFNTFEIVAVVFSVFLVNSIVDDGESNWLEGVQLLTAYVIIATAFYFFH